MSDKGAETTGRRIGALVMAYGTPAAPEQVPEYYTHIRRGRPPTEEQLADLVRRYEAIGGVSPMRERTEEQLATIRRSLANDHEGDFIVQLGQKHAAPFIEDGVRALIDAGVDVIVGLVLAPHYSASSVGQYHQRARQAIEDSAPGGSAPGGSAPIDYRAIDDWSTEPSFVEFTGAALRRQLDTMPQRTWVVFTAHSLPQRVLVDDPYIDRLAASAAAVADTLGLGREDWTTGWQSAGRTPEPWAGPDILEIISALDGVDPEGILVVPQGFTSDHLEILFDLDIEARAAAEKRGLSFARTDTINADPTVMGALAHRIASAAR